MGILFLIIIIVITNLQVKKIIIIKTKKVKEVIINKMRL